MRTLIAAGILLILFSCSYQQQKDNKTVTAVQVSKDSSMKMAQTVSAADPINDQAQPLEGPATNENRLKQLSDLNFFSTVHNKLLPALPENHQQFLKSNADLSVISFARGDLFQNGQNDYAFIVFDKKEQKISIILYEEQTNNYRKLYREINVEDGLDSLDCNYRCGPLDENLEGEIMYQSQYLVKNPLMYLESKQIKIADIAKDEDIVIKMGCLSKKATKADYKNVLCITTSCVYNSWKCLRYDKSKDLFVIFYCQTFSD
jgi:hypothetical protein